MSAEMIAPIEPGSTTQTATLSDSTGGGAGRGGSENSPQGPLVVVQQPRSASPPRPTPRTNQSNTDNSLRNGYAAISHSVSGETAAIGLGFLLAGPAGAIIGGTALPVLAAASMWRARRREHDANTNASNGTGSGSGGTSRDRSGGRSGSNNAGGRHRTPNGAGGGRHQAPKSPGAGGGAGHGGKPNKPKTKDPVADKLGQLGKGLADKFKNRGHKGPKNGTDTPSKDRKDRAGGKGTGGTDPKARKTRKDHRGDYPDDRRWRGRGHKDKPEKTKNRKGSSGDDTTSTTAPNGLAPKSPNGGHNPVDDRIDLIKKRRERNLRRQAIKTGKRAEKNAARDGTMGDPLKVKLERIREEHQRIDYELHRTEQILALAAATEERRSSPVNYPAISSQPVTRTAGVAVARQIDVRGSDAYRILTAMADQLAHGLHTDDDADMADHVVELAGIPALCRNLATAVREATSALQKTAPLHPSVIKHMNNAAVAALTAANMADTIILVFVVAHREDIYRVLEPRIGEERWNIRNAAGTLDGAKLRAAILSAGTQRLALPAGTSPAGATSHTRGGLVPASAASTRKLITLTKGFDRGHMVDCLSEIGGTASGVDAVADAITKLYRRMANAWPTESVVDDTVRVTASKVKTVAAELLKAVKAAQRAHERELRLNANPRKGAHAEKKWDTVRGRQG